MPCGITGFLAGVVLLLESFPAKSDNVPGGALVGGTINGRVGFSVRSGAGESAFDR